MANEESGTSEGSSSGTGGNSSSHSNTTSLTQSIEKLDGSVATGESNYNAWRFRIIRILQEKNLLSAIEEETVSSAAKDHQAFTIITLNIKDSQILHIQDTTTARKAWEALKEVHQGIATNGRMILMQGLWALKMSEGQDMSEHLNRFRELANQLRGLSTEGKEFDDSELLTMLTLSLPESYEPLVMALQSRSNIVTFDMMGGRLLQESARRQVGKVTHNGLESSTPGGHTAFTVNRAPNNTRFCPGRGSFHAYGRGRGGFHGSVRVYSATSTGWQNIRGNTATGTIRPPAETKCYYCGKEGHWKKDCFKRKAEEVGTPQSGGASEFTFFAEAPAQAARGGWIIDSGASQHLCGNRKEFSTYTTISKTKAIMLADGTTIEAAGIGDIVITIMVGSITLTDVWHVPNIGGNLMSVSRMIDAGFRV